VIVEPLLLGEGASVDSAWIVSRSAETAINASGPLRHGTQQIVPYCFSRWIWFIHSDAPEFFSGGFLFFISYTPQLDRQVVESPVYYYGQSNVVTINHGYAGFG